MTELNASAAAEPMSDEQLDVIAERWSLARADEDFRLTIYESSAPGALNVALHSAGSDVETLLNEVRRLRSLLATPHERAAAALLAHSEELMAAAMKLVLKDDPDGFNEVRRAATVDYAAKLLRGEVAS